MDPYEALDRMLEKNDDFIQRHGREKFQALAYHLGTRDLVIEAIMPEGSGLKFRCTHPNGKKYVAKTSLRRLRKKGHSEQDDERIIREAEILAQLEGGGGHDWVASRHEVLMREPMSVLLLDYWNGTDLRSRIRNEGKLPVDQAILLAAKGCEGLDYIHQQRILHGDIKPSNIVLTHYGGIKIIDFDLSRSWSRFTNGVQDNNWVIGSPWYLAPEAWTKQMRDARTDIYALGVTLYEAVFRDVPFKGEVMEIGLAHVYSFIPSAIETLPKEVSAVIKKALAKDPKERYQSAAEMKEALLKCI